MIFPYVMRTMEAHFSLKSTIPQPFIKWVGGKRNLTSEILKAASIDEESDISGYFEPFLGGGAMFYALLDADILSKARKSKRIHLSDINAPLVSTYRVVRVAVDKLIRGLDEHRKAHFEDLKLAADKDIGRADRGGQLARRGARTALYRHYLAVRDNYNKLKETFSVGKGGKVSEDEVRLASMFLYLNRAGFNGMYRENSKGEMNIPPGRYANPEIVNEAVLKACAESLKSVDLQVRSFEEALAEAKEGDLVYLDPPYFETFTAYAKGGFNLDSQESLACAAQTAAKRGARVVISNSDTQEMRKLYKAKGFKVSEIKAARNINSDGAGRAKVTEIVAYNSI